MKYLSVLAVAALFTAVPLSAADLLIYSSRHSSYLQPLLNEYSRETGLSVQLVNAPASALLSRLAVEGENSRAALLIMTGAENFIRAANRQLLAPVDSTTLQSNVPAYLRAPDNSWFALSKRIRTIVYNSATVNPENLGTLAGLATEQWRGKLCLLTSQADYSRMLIAALIEQYGEAASQTILNGWVANMAIPPLPDDNAIIQAIGTGECDIGIINSYYFARETREHPDTKLRIFWSDQAEKGGYANITGAAVLAHAPDKEQATDLLEWLTTRRSQARYSRFSMEFPVNPEVYPPKEIARWGPFRANKTPLYKSGLRLTQAARLAQITGYE